MRPPKTNEGAARRTERATKDDARNQGIGRPDHGVELPATESGDQTGASFLGVGEPATPVDRPDKRDDVAGETPG